MWLYLPERVSPPAVLAARREHHGGHVGVPVSTWIAEAVNTPVPHTRSTARTVAADRSHEILDAATRAFAQHGYQATSLRSIAADMGLAHGTLLYYFDSKEALLEAVLNRRDREADTAYITPATAYDTVSNLYRRAVYNQQHPDRVALYSAILCEAANPAHPAHAFFATRYTRVLDTLVVQIRSLRDQGFFRPDVDAEAEAAWLTALWDGLQVHARFAAVADIPERLLRHVDTLISDAVPGARRAQLLAPDVQ